MAVYGSSDLCFFCDHTSSCPVFAEISHLRRIGAVKVASDKRCDFRRNSEAHRLGILEDVEKMKGKR